MSKVLIHIIAFSPDGVSTAYLYKDIAMKFKEKGFEVSVLTTTPHYNIIQEELRKQPLKPVLGGLYYKSCLDGIKIKHIPQKKFKNVFFRIIGFIYWHLMALILGLFEKKVSIIISPSPPLTIGFINIVLSKLKGCKTIYNVQEIYPDLMIESGILKSTIIIKALYKLEKFVYNNSSKVTTIDEVFNTTIVKRFKDSSNLHIIPNFVDTSIFKPLSKKDIELDSFLFPNSDSLKIMYAGNIGYAQDWQTLINLAIQLKGENIDFFIIGEGVLKKNLEEQISINNLTNVHLISYHTREMMPSIIAYSDLQFIFLSPQTEGHGFPSKIYSIMACSKPILVSSGANTPIINFLAGKNCALLEIERDSVKKMKNMVSILKSVDYKQLEELGKNGLSIIKKNYSKEIVTNMWVQLANSMLHN